MPSYYIRQKDLSALRLIPVCVYCGADKNLTIDHIIPRIKGGGNELDNLTRACGRCNSLKNEHEMHEFLNRILDKREIVYDKTLSCLYRLRTQLRRHGSNQSEYQKWLIGNINKGRNEHSYFTAIIDSIINDKYKVLTGLKSFNLADQSCKISK